MIADDDLDNLDDDHDDLEEFITECTRENPDFPAMVDAALQRRQVARANAKDQNKPAEADDESETPEILTSRFEA